MTTRASSSVLHSGLNDMEEDIDATFTDDDEAVNSDDDDDDDDDDEEDIEDVEEDGEDEEVEDDWHMPSWETEAAITKRLAQMKAGLGLPLDNNCFNHDSDDDSDDDVDIDIDIFCPLSDLSKKEKDELKKARTIRQYDSVKGVYNRPISKKKKRLATSSAPTTAIDVKNPSGKRSLLASPVLSRKDPKAAYLPHQIDAIEKLTGLLVNGEGCLLAHAPGWGKTLSTLAILSTMQKKDQTKPMTAIILYPLTLASVWRSEFDKWDFPNLEFWKVFETKKQIDDFIDTHSSSLAQPGVMRLVMMTHDLFVHAVDANLKAALNMVDFLVIDEVHVFKNDATKKHIAVINSKSNDFCGRTIGLTGTPVQNNVAELYGLLNLIQTNYFGSMTKKDVLSKAGANCKNSSLADVMIKNDWLYKCLTRIMHRQDSSSVLHSLLTNDDYAICFNAGFDVDSSLQPSKPALQAREEMLQQSKEERLHIMTVNITGCIDRGNKVLVFSERKEFLEVLYKRFENKSLLLTGDTSNPIRAKLVNEFQSKDSIQVFFLSIKAAGMGITLTKATHVFICDACWNPTYETQAIARAVRIGQSEIVKVYRLLAQSSIEIMIARDGPNKLGTADRIVDDKPLSSIFSQEQLREKNPQYIVDPNDKNYEVPDNDEVLEYLVYASCDFKTFNYAKLIDTATKKHTEKEAWAYAQHMLKTMHYKDLEVYTECAQRDGADRFFETNSLWPPIVEYDDSFASCMLTCKFGPWKTDQMVTYSMQIAYGDHEKFISDNPVWECIQVGEIVGRDDIIVFQLNSVDDSKYMAVRLRAHLMDKYRCKTSDSKDWSDASAVFKKSFFV